MSQLLRAIWVAAYITTGAYLSYTGYQYARTVVQSLFIGVYDPTHFAGNDPASRDLQTTVSDIRSQAYQLNR